MVIEINAKQSKRRIVILYSLWLGGRFLREFARWERRRPMNDHDGEAIVAYQSSWSRVSAHFVGMSIRDITEEVASLVGRPAPNLYATLRKEEPGAVYFQSISPGYIVLPGDKIVFRDLLGAA